MELGEQVGDDRVVVAGVERDLIGAARGGHPAHQLQRAVPVEGRSLDGDDGRDRRELAPEVRSSTGPPIAVCR